MPKIGYGKKRFMCKNCQKKIWNSNEKETKFDFEKFEKCGSSNNSVGLLLLNYYLIGIFRPTG